jgi:NTP pyrophosphatase (non-canonical NTP hydrolase)
LNEQIAMRLQQIVNKIYEKYNLNPSTDTLLLALGEELGEVFRARIRRIGGDYFVKPGADRGDIKKELGDVLYLLCAVANKLCIDLDEAFSDVCNKNIQRLEQQ